MARHRPSSNMTKESPLLRDVSFDSLLSHGASKGFRDYCESVYMHRLFLQASLFAVKPDRIRTSWSHILQIECSTNSKVADICFGGGDHINAYRKMTRVGRRHVHERQISVPANGPSLGIASLWNSSFRNSASTD